MGAADLEPMCEEELVELRHAFPALDANQQPAFERALERLFATNPNADESELRAEAADIARGELETAEVVASRIASLRKGPAYCYLAFHGMGESAMFVKIGMSRHPEQRLYQMATGNPLDCLWVFLSRAPDARAAHRVEQALLRELADHKRRGEWLSLGEGVGEADAAQFAKTMTGIAKSIEPDAGDFEAFTYRDGRKSA